MADFYHMSANPLAVLEPAQVTAAVALMRKVLPDLVAAEVKSEAVHKFAVVPEVMSEDEWLKYRGQPRYPAAAELVELPAGATGDATCRR
jgi:hypothetical protein